MNSRASASALRATMRVHGPKHHIPGVLSLGYRSIGHSGVIQTRQLPSISLLLLQRQYSSQSTAAANKNYTSPSRNRRILSSNNTRNLKLSPEDANPPSTTRPPPLALPTREPNTSNFSHLFSTGKAYLTFYKTGLKNIFHNTRLLYPSKSTDRSLIPRKDTRAHLLLRTRWRYDIERLPIFALLLLVCGEFTPFVVVLLPSLVPYTCRLPQHVDKLRKQQEDRRAVSLTHHQHAMLSNPGAHLSLPYQHIARSLGLISTMWDKIGYVPKMYAGGRVYERLYFVEKDSKLLLEAGGVDALEDEEVRLACCDRGIDVTGRSDEELRGVLERWLRLVMLHDGGQEEILMRMVVLMSQSEYQWPREI